MRENIRHYAEIAAPLNALKQTSSKEVVWTNEATRAFQLLKQAIKTAPMLSYFSDEQHLALSLDASTRGVGAVFFVSSSPEELPMAHNVVSFTKYILKTKTGSDSEQKFYYRKKKEICFCGLPKLPGLRSNATYAPKSLLLAFN
jgi:hypothetical protein